jgi:hypothetical protein
MIKYLLDAGADVNSSFKSAAHKELGVMSLLMHATKHVRCFHFSIFPFFRFSSFLGSTCVVFIFPVFRIFGFLVFSFPISIHVPPLACHEALRRFHFSIFPFF